MVSVLRNKNYASRLQIMVEIASNGPNIQQRAIAENLGVTPQAISDYVLQLISEGMIISTARSRYRLSGEGVNWVLKQLREINEYTDMSARAVSDLGICPAIAGETIFKGDKVGLIMRDGLLYAVKDPQVSAQGIAETRAKEGEDVGVSAVEGVVQMEKGTVDVILVPSIRLGGSKKVPKVALKKAVEGRKLIGAVGIESLSALRRVGCEPSYFYGVAAAANDAAQYGVSMLVVCAEDEYPSLSIKLKEGNTATRVLPLS